MENERSREIKVGLFALGLLMAGAVTLFLIGGSSDLLKDRYTLHGSWKDVSGLKEGAVVRLAGQDVGEVSAIRFSDDLGVKEVFVEMKLMDEYRPRIRKDSEARIDTVGVLGDKYVAISMGDPSQPELDDGAWISTRPPLDILEYTKKLTGILENVENISRKVDLMIGNDQEAAAASLSQSLAHVESILNEAKNGKGLLHALVYDEGMTRKVAVTLGNLEAMSGDLRDATHEVRTGDGLANALIYADEGKQLAKDLAELSAAMGQLAKDIKNEESLAHSLLYDPSKAKLVDDLAATAAALKSTSESISQGDGTIGLLARDPALYEDLRALVGGAQRNKLLRSYIRRTVQEGEAANASPWAPAPE